jgi:S-formylglutathione hydrolase FrmB
VPDPHDSRQLGIRLNRRSVLLGLTSLATLGVTSLSAASSSAHSAHSDGIAVREERYSRYRHQNVEVVYTLPHRTTPPGMPMVVLLHGRHSSARAAGPGGLVTALGRAVADGRIPAFGFIAVDGGSTYWHEHHRGDDPMGMLLEEVPEWLRARELAGTDGTPFAAVGTSMGGFGALLYARRRAERGHPVRAVGAIAPALMSWRRMRRRRAWRSKAEWASMDPLHNTETLRGIPTGVWCGTEDTFIDGVRAFIRRVHPEVAYLAPGRHSPRFFRSTVPSLLNFLGKHVPKPV